MTGDPPADLVRALSAIAFPEQGLPGSAGEHSLQRELGSQARAGDFYDRQVVDHLTQEMRDFIAGQGMLFMATSDRDGNCDCGVRCGPPGFAQVAGDTSLLIPDYRGNGVYSSFGNISENGHASVLFIDFEQTRIGLHVNGTAELIENSAVAGLPGCPRSLFEAAHQAGGRRALRWVHIGVQEAYIQCKKHIPRLVRDDSAHRSWGTDSPAAKGGDFFNAAREDRPWRQRPGA